jgi:hypothetical protein
MKSYKEEGWRYLLVEEEEEVVERVLVSDLDVGDF